MLNLGHTPRAARILFLGNTYNPLSTACLEAIVQSGYEPVVGFYDPFSKGTWELFRNRLKSRGWGPVLYKAVQLTRCETRIVLRKMGFSLSGFVSLTELSRALGLETIRCTDPNSPEFIEQVRLLKVDLIVVAAFTRILKNALINVPRVGCVNVHTSLLPQYRGPEPCYWVLANHESTTGVTLHHMDEGIDSGDIILQRKLAIRPDETEFTLRQRSAQAAAELLCEGIPRLLAGNALRIPQDNSTASYYSFPPRASSILGPCHQSHRSPTVQVAAYTPMPLHAPLHALDPLQDPRWRAFVDEHPRASVFHTVPWLDALRRTYRYQPIVYTTSRPGRDLQNGIVFCRVESCLTGRRLVSLPFSDHCEPLVDSAEELEQLLGFVLTTNGFRNWKYVELRPTSDTFRSVASQRGFQPSKQYYLHTLDLRRSESELFQGFHGSSVQRRIQRGERADLVHESGQSDDLLRKFYELALLTRRRHRILPQREGWFRNLRACMGNALEIHVASHKKTPVAGMITLRFKDTVVYKYGGSDQAYHNLGSVPFLWWKVMRQTKSERMQKFDLGRSDFCNQGLIDFKDRWGAERTVLTYWQSPKPGENLLVDDGPALRAAKHFLEFMPNSVLKVAGGLLYRHIG